MKEHAGPGRLSDYHLTELTVFKKKVKKTEEKKIVFSISLKLKLLQQNGAKFCKT